VLDEQLCPIYANVIAEDLLALHLPSMRGRPLVHFLPGPQRFACAVRRALESEAPVDCTLRAGIEPWRENAHAVNVRITPLRNQMFGAYILVELSARTCAQFPGAAVS